MYCKKCGKEIKAGDRFCASCGAPMDNNDSTVGMSGTERQKKSGRTALIVAVAVCIVAVVAGGIFLVASRNGDKNTRAKETGTALWEDEEPLYEIHMNVYVAADVWTDEEGSLVQERLSGATVSIREGAGAHEGEILTTLQADDDGRVNASLPSGIYTAQVDVPGYAVCYLEIEVEENEVELSCYALPLAEEEARLLEVLNGENSDLRKLMEALTDLTEDSVMVKVEDINSLLRGEKEGIEKFFFREVPAASCLAYVWENQPENWRELEQQTGREYFLTEEQANYLIYSVCEKKIEFDFSVYNGQGHLCGTWADPYIGFGNAAGRSSWYDLENFSVEHLNANIWKVWADAFHCYDYESIIEVERVCFTVVRNPDSCFEGYSLKEMSVDPVLSLCWENYSQITTGWDTTITKLCFSFSNGEVIDLELPYSPSVIQDIKYRDITGDGIDEFMVYRHFTNTVGEHALIDFIEVKDGIVKNISPEMEITELAGKVWDTRIVDFSVDGYESPILQMISYPQNNAMGYSDVDQTYLVGYRDGRWQIITSPVFSDEQLKEIAESVRTSSSYFPDDAEITITQQEGPPSYWFAADMWVSYVSVSGKQGTFFAYCDCATLEPVRGISWIGAEESLEPYVEPEPTPHVPTNVWEDFAYQMGQHAADIFNTTLRNTEVFIIGDTVYINIYTELVDIKDITLTESPNHENPKKLWWGSNKIYYHGTNKVYDHDYLGKYTSGGYEFDGIYNPTVISLPEVFYVNRETQYIYDDAGRVVTWDPRYLEIANQIGQKIYGSESSFTTEVRMVKDSYGTIRVRIYLCGDIEGKTYVYKDIHINQNNRDYWCGYRADSPEWIIYWSVEGEHFYGID